MNAVFADTDGWMACADRSDPAHVACTAPVTDARGRPPVGSARLRWERVGSDRFERARNLFFQFWDKDLSFTDCTSFAIMCELKLTTVITTDWHFRQVGFDVVPATRPRRTRTPRRS